MAISAVSSGLISQTSKNPSIVFLVDGKEIECETHFLINIEYFRSLLNSGMREALQGRITVPNFSFQVFSSFITYLKSGTLPSLPFDELTQLFQLAHLYQQLPLIDLISSQLIREIPSHLGEILNLASLYKRQDIKEACRSQLEKRDNWHAYRSDDEDESDDLHAWLKVEYFDAIQEALTWDKKIIKNLLYSAKRLFQELLKKKRFDLAVDLLKAAERIGEPLSRFSGNLLKLLCLLLSQEDRQQMQEFTDLLNQTEANDLAGQDFDGNTFLHIAFQCHRFHKAYLLADKNSLVLWTQNQQKKLPLEVLEGKEREQALQTIMSSLI